MQTIFSVPMRTNNNNDYLSGDIRFGDIFDFTQHDRITAVVAVEVCNPGNSILISVKFLDGVVQLSKQDRLITAPEDYYMSFWGGMFNTDTLINASIHTNGQARFSIDIVALQSGEDYPGAPV